MSPWSASRGPAERVSVHVPRLWERWCPERTVAGSCHKNSDFCLIFGIPRWLMPYTRPQRSKQPAIWAQGDHSSQSSLEPVNPPPPPSLPLSFFAFWGFPEWNTQDLPSLSLVCPWTIVRSWEHLPFSPLPFSPSLFLSFSLSSLHPLPWVSLDAFVIPSFLVCPWMLVS